MNWKSVWNEKKIIIVALSSPRKKSSQRTFFSSCCVIHNEIFICIEHTAWHIHTAISLFFLWQSVHAPIHLFIRHLYITSSIIISSSYKYTKDDTLSKCKWKKDEGRNKKILFRFPFIYIDHNGKYYYQERLRRITCVQSCPWRIP